MFPKRKLRIIIWKLCQVSFETGANRKRENRYLHLGLCISKLPMEIAPETSAYRS